MQAARLGLGKGSQSASWIKVPTTLTAHYVMSIFNCDLSEGQMTSLADAPPGRKLMMPNSVEKYLPSMVRTELSWLSPSDQEAFLEEFRRRSKGLGVAYLCSLLYCHYGFLGRWGMTVIMWLAALVTFGAAGLIWWLIDLFRMPGLILNYNRNIAVEVLRTSRPSKLKRHSRL